MLDENLVAQLVKRKVIADTFRRLAPEKKEQVYRAAIRLFGEYGYDGLSVDQISREAGISKGSFFQYFPSKSHFLEFTVLVFDDYLARWVEEVRGHEHAVLARDRIVYLYHALIVNSKLFPAEQKFFLFINHGLQHAGVALEGVEPARHFREYITEIIRRGEAAGEIRGDFEPEVTSYLVSIIMEGMVQRQFSRQQWPSSRVEEYLASFLFDGIKV